MSALHVFGYFSGEKKAASPPSATADPPLSELSLVFTPLDLVTEWARCSETANFLAQFFARDFADREIAGNVLSTVINELVENAVKFSSDKSIAARLVVRAHADRLTIVTTNVVSPDQATAFGDTITRLVAGDPEALFAEQVAHPPATGGAGIGLILLRKDYGATIGARMTPSDRPGTTTVDVEVTIDNRDVEQR